MPAGALLGIDRGQQHRQQVPAIARILAPFGDHAVDQPIEIGLSSANASHGGQRQIEEQLQEKAEMPGAEIP